jgi:coproporphyrinogen III oxidase
MNVKLFFCCFQKWEYMHTPIEQSKEWKLLEVLKDPKDWVGTGSATH